MLLLIVLIPLCCVFSSVEVRNFENSGLTENPLDKYLCEISSCWNWQIYYHRFYIPKIGRNSLHAENLLKCVNSNIGQRVIVRQLDESVKASDKDSLHIVFVTEFDSENISNATAVLDQKAREKKSSFYIFVFKYYRMSQSALDDFFTSVWEKEYLNVISISDEIQPEVYTFEPFSMQGFRIVRLTGNGCSNFFYDKSRNLHGAEVPVIMFADRVRAIPRANGKGYYGVDGYFAAAVEKAVNANFSYLQPSDGNRYGNKVGANLTGAIADITSRRAVVSFNIRFTLEEHAYGVESTYFLERRNIAFLVPKGAAVPKYLNIVQAYDTSTWISVIVCYLTIVVIYILLQKTALGISHLHEDTDAPFNPIANRDVLLIFFKTLLGEPVATFPKLISLRQFIMAWMLFCFVISNMYCGKLESIFVQPDYAADPQSARDLQHIHPPYYSVPMYVEALQNHSYPGLYDEIKSKIVLLPTMSDLLKLPHNATLIVRREMARYIIYRTFNKALKRPAYHMVSDFLSSLPKSYIVPRGSWFLPKINQMVKTFTENGLIAYWQKYSRFLDTIKGEASDDIDNPDKFVDEQQELKVVLTLEILQSAFYLWAIGLMTSGTVFLMEQAYFYYRMHFGYSTVAATSLTTAEMSTTV